MSVAAVPFLPATEVAGAIRRGDLSPVEVVDALVERIRALDPRLHAIVTLLDEQARKAAREAERTARSGAALGPLHGVPFTVKDALDTAGVRTTRGSRLFADRVPEQDATAVARLKRAGGILLAKTSLPEFAAWWETDNLLTGTTVNPWDLTRTAGGSSGGESAAIAAGLSPLGLGSDVGISVRGPAHMTGIAALKPTHGRIPLTGHWPPAPRSMWHLGPMARTVADVALAYDVLHGPDGRDGNAVHPRDATAARGTPGGEPIRVGWLTAPGFGPVDPDVAVAVADAAGALADLGCAVEPVTVPALEDHDFTRIGSTFFAAEFGPLFRAAAAGREAELHAVGRGVTEREQSPIGRYVEARQATQQLRDAFARYFARHDLLLCPVVPFPAPPPGQAEHVVAGESVPGSHAMRATIPFNLTGLPAFSLPFRFSAEGLPIGVQLVGRWLDEATVLRVAGLLEQASDVSGRHPPL